MPSKSNAAYFTWPLLPELFPVSFHGVKTSRDDFLVDVDRDRLVKRLKAYFGPKASHDDLRREHPGIMQSTAPHSLRAAPRNTEDATTLLATPIKTPLSGGLRGIQG